MTQYPILKKKQFNRISDKVELDGSGPNQKGLNQETTDDTKVRLPNPLKTLPHKILQGTKNLAPTLTPKDPYKHVPTAK